MAEDILRLNTIDEYNKWMMTETLHPLVTVVDFSKLPAAHYGRYSFDFYAIMLKDANCGEMIYGRNYYDYQEGTLLFVAPGQISGVKDNGEPHQPKGKAIAFHPDFIRGTSLGRTIKNYTFFSYEVNEALHISEQERLIVDECFNNINIELHHAIDKHSRRLIVNNIELLLNYCVRFYDRQFITRENVNKDIVTKFESLLHDYFDRKNLEEDGVPTVSYCADKLNLSANYFGDLVKKETGKSAQEYIQSYLIDVAKERVLDDSLSVSEVAYRLGFKYPQHFARLFKRRVGMTPLEYRHSFEHPFHSFHQN